MMFPYLDSTIVLLIPAMLFSLWAQFKVKGAFSRYSEVRAASGVTADQVSRVLLDKFGLGNVRVERIQAILQTIMTRGARCFAFQTRYPEIQALRQ